MNRDDRVYYEDLKLMERLEENQEKLEENNRRRRKRKYDPLESEIETILEIDRQIKDEFLFYPLIDQKARRDQVVEDFFGYYPEAYENFKDKEDLSDLLNNLRWRKKLKSLRTLPLDAFPSEILILILTSGGKTWVNLCNMIQKMCSLSRICDDLWSQIAIILEIPVTKPEDVSWREWIRLWCIQLSPDFWDDVLYQNFEQSYDKLQIDRYKQTIWIMKHSPPTDVQGWHTEVLYLDDTILKKETKWNAQDWINDPIWLKEALRHDVRFLWHTNERLRKDRNIVRYACAHDPIAFLWAHDEVRSDPTFIREFMMTQPQILVYMDKIDIIKDPQLSKIFDLLNLHYYANDETDDIHTSFAYVNEIRMVQSQYIDIIYTAPYSNKRYTRRIGSHGLVGF